MADRQSTQSQSEKNTIVAGNLRGEIQRSIDAEGAARYRQLMAKQRDLQRKLSILRRRKSSVLSAPKCFPSASIYGGKSFGNNAYLCSIDSQIAYREGVWKVHSAEIRVFIEGAEVTPYLRGDVRWTIESTGGMNTCSFTLNNNQDAFIVTPMNVCADLNSHGWMLARDKKGRIITSPYRSSSHTDEWAKYKIYRQKYLKVRPGTKDEQIDETGMWLYPLNPYGCIFNKHDCVRVFYRLPHMAGAVKKKNGKIIRYNELWVPAFTGFIDEYDIIDDFVNGDRQINIKCYDIRGILNRMRVRTQASPISSTNDQGKRGKGDNSLQDAVQREIETSPVFVEAKKLGIDLAWLRNIDNQEIAVEFIRLFNSLFEHRLVAANCKKDGKYDIACAKKVYAETKGEVQAQVKEFYAAYKNAVDVIDKANKVDGGKRKIVMKPKSKGRLELSYGDAKPIDLGKSITELIGFLHTKGREIISAAQTVSAAYKTAQSKIKANPNASNKEKIEGLLYNNYGPVYTIIDDLLKNINDNDLEKQLSWDKREDISAKSAIRKIAGGSSNFATAFLPNDSRSEQNFIENYSGYYWPQYNDVSLLLSAYVAKKVENFKSNLPRAKGKRDFAEKSRRELEKYLKKYVDTSGTLIVFNANKMFKDTVYRYITPEMNNGLIQALTEYNEKYVKGALGSLKYKQADLLKELNSRLETVRKAFKDAEAKVTREEKRDPNVRRQRRIQELRRQLREAHTKGQSDAVKQSEAGGTKADFVHTAAQFNEKNAGMYQDLVNALSRDSHPLAGMSYETAVKWLTLTHLPTSMGIELDLDKYDTRKMQAWNKTVLFGIIGRPFTYREVSAIGHGTVSDRSESAVFSPLQCFVHMLLPKSGTGAATIVHQNIGHATGTEGSYRYETRLSLLNAISDTLDYQFYVSPMGDMIFEFPMYNGLPSDWGKVFSGAYKVAKELISDRITPETGPMYTAWVLTGEEDDETKKAAFNQLVQNLFKKKVIVAPILAQRIGAKVKQINVKIPGIGGLISANAGVASLLAYAYLEIQKDMGQMSSMSIKIPFRPYLLPNRPIHLVPRQRIGMIKNVSYSMSPPDGNCTVDMNVSYVKELFRDGTFRTITGGSRMPIDYSGLFTGDIKYNMRWGARKAVEHRTLGRSMGAAAKSISDASGHSVRDMRNTNWSCGPLLRDRYIEASAFSVDRLSQFRVASTYGGSTAGAAGQSGDIPKYLLHGLHGGFVGTRVSREPPNPGDKAEAITTKDTGLHDGNAKKHEGDKPIYDVRRLFYNPYPYGFVLGGPATVKGNPSVFSNYGPVRGVGDAYKSRFSWHNGVDLIAPKGTPIHTPIKPTICILGIPAGWRTNQKKKYRVHVTKFPSLFPFIIQGTKPKDVGDGFLEVVVDEGMLKRFKKYSNGAATPRLNPKGYSTKIGMFMEVVGSVTLPGDASKSLYVTLRFGHLDDVVKPSGSNYYFGLHGYSRLPKAGEKIAYVGNTGNSSTYHVHVEMLIHTNSKRTDQSALQETLKANREYMRTMLAMKVTGNNIKSDKMSEKWQRYFNRINEHRRKQGKKPIETVDDALDYLMRPASWPTKDNLRYRFYRTVKLRGDALFTNPFFFFKPEEILPTLTSDYRKYYKYVNDIYIYRPDRSTQRYSLCGSTVILKERLNIFRKYNACKKAARRKRGRRNRISAVKECKLQLTTALEKHYSGIPSRRNENATIRIANRLDAKVDKDTAQGRMDTYTRKPASRRS